MDSKRFMTLVKYFLEELPSFLAFIVRSDTFRLIELSIRKHDSINTPLLAERSSTLERPFSETDLPLIAY